MNDLAPPPGMPASGLAPVRPTFSWTSVGLVLLLWMVFLAIPLTFGSGMALSFLDRWEEQRNRLAGEEGTRLLDQVLVAQNRGYPDLPLLRELISLHRYGWLVERDNQRFCLAIADGLQARIQLCVTRHGHPVYSSRPGPDADLLIGALRWLDRNRGRNASAATRLDRGLVKRWGREFHLTNLAPRIGEFSLFGTGDRLGLTFLDLRPDGFGLAFVAEDIGSATAKAALAASLAPLNHNGDRVGRAIPDLDLWSPPAGIPISAMKQVWELRRTQSGRQVPFAGRRWFQDLDKWGKWTVLVLPPLPTSGLRGARFLLLAVVFLGAVWGILLLWRWVGGTMTGFFPIRTQLGALFAYVTILPLISALLLGWLALEDQKVRLRDTFLAGCLDRLNTLEGGYPATRNQYLRICRDIRNTPVVTRALPDEVAKMMDGYRSQVWLDQYYLADLEGRVLATNIQSDVKAGIRAAVGMLNRFAGRRFLNHRLSSTQGDRVSALDIVSDEVITSEEMGWSALLQVPGSVHALTMGRTSIELFWDIFPELATGPSLISITQDQHHLVERHYEAAIASRTDDVKLFLVNNINHRMKPTPPEAWIEPLRNLALVSEQLNQAVQRTIDLNGRPFWAIAFPDSIGMRFSLIGLYEASRSLSQLRSWTMGMLFGLGLALATAFLAGRLLMRLFLDPIRDLELGIEAIRHRQTSHVIPIRRQDEFGQLSSAFNLLLREMQELNLARVVQGDLFPKHWPPIPGYSCAVRNFTASDLGGDYYDILQLANGRFLFVIGDATGHGSSAALAMAMAKAATAFRTGEEAFSLQGLLEAINEVFFQELRRHRKFMTLLVGELDPVENLLKLQNAGQNYPIILNGKTGQAELPDMPGFPMGVRRQVDTSARDFSLAPGDTVVFYTDGIPECEVGREVYFGMQPFIEVTGRFNQRGATALDILDGFLAEFDRCRLPGPLLDDVTMIVLRRND